MFNNAEIRSVLSNLRGYYSVAAAFSLAINLLYLAGPLYMLQVYDRVMSSGSLVTLTMLSLILLVSYAALVLLDGVRSRILNRAGLRIDALLSRRVMMAALERPELRSQPMRDLDTVRFFATGAGVQALFDVPWIPIYLIVLFLLHSAVGIFALCGMAALVLLAGLNEVVLKRSLSQSGDAANRNYAFTDVSMRNSDSVRAMGMAEGLLTRWSEDRDRMLHAQVVASDRGGVLSGAIKYLRMSMQSMVLAVGAYLVIERLAAGGIMFASNMLLGRALQPVEQLVGNWRNFVNARDALARLTQLLESVPAEKPALTLPSPMAG
ncbi:ABC transporter transmembrane domain-containing protein [Gellertiella hungarica]|uniref:ABC-type protease/lipase transport system fused ATPase/permease subunit n=1 Tax=Gellertiella hungarica TaxID=1572859 RepID=A0A7W6J861_9HYPH|nr:ABC transporter transmembrane domain-containing protein [Gellertiella hungarica]MBB4066568.1 ABC-type protease/lipase transport system fused ATPase/permease subunit [Gellertiella hungarica]